MGLLTTGHLIPNSSLPCDIYHFDLLDSTNQRLKDWMPPKDTAIYADFQTAGRGQGDHTWHCREKEGLLMSLLYYPPENIRAEDLLQISAVSLCLCLDTYLGPGLETTIKAPNDILVDGKKLAGILLENRFQANQLNACIIGVGINLYQDQFPDHIAYARPPVSLKQLGIMVDRRTLLFEYLGEFYRQVKLDFGLIQEIYEGKTGIQP